MTAAAERSGVAVCTQPRRAGTPFVAGRADHGLSGSAILEPALILYAPAAGDVELKLKFAHSRAFVAWRVVLGRGPAMAFHAVWTIRWGVVLRGHRVGGWVRIDNGRTEDDIYGAPRRARRVWCSRVWRAIMPARVPHWPGRGSPR